MNYMQDDVTASDSFETVMQNALEHEASRAAILRMLKCTTMT